MKKTTSGVLKKATNLVDFDGSGSIFLRKRDFFV